MPKPIQKQGQVAGLRATCMRPSRQPIRFCAPDAWDTDEAAPAGRSLTTSQIATASSNDAQPAPANTTRQDTRVTIQASGAAAASAPVRPIMAPRPVAVAKRRSSNQLTLSFNMDTKATETPRPARVRPSTAAVTDSAAANASEPIPAITQPAASTRGGP